MEEVVGVVGVDRKHQEEGKVVEVVDVPTPCLKSRSKTLKTRLARRTALLNPLEIETGCELRQVHRRFVHSILKKTLPAE